MGTAIRDDSHASNNRPVISCKQINIPFNYKCHASHYNIRKIALATETEIGAINYATSTSVPGPTKTPNQRVIAEMKEIRSKIQYRHNSIIYSFRFER